MKTLMTDPTWPEPVSAQRQLPIDDLERRADAPERWRWLASTRRLQREAYGDDDWPKQGEALANSVQMNITAIIAELGEMLTEVGWKPWAENRGWVNREQYLKELVDVGHFLANLLVAVGCDDEEWERRYQDKQALNTRRQAAGYDGLKGKCHACRRALDDGGLMMRPNPRHEGSFQYVCAGCGAIQSDEVLAELEELHPGDESRSTYGIRLHRPMTLEEAERARRYALETSVLKDIKLPE